MTTADDTRQIVSAFLDARADAARRDAIELIAPSFTFMSPMMRITDRAAYLQTHRGFQLLVTGRDTISELYGPDEATLIYDLHTATAAGIQRTVEHIRLSEGKVASILIVFDATPWRSLLEPLDVKPGTREVAS